MSDGVLLIAAAIVSVIGFAGAFIHIAPGSVFSYLAIWLCYWSGQGSIDMTLMWETLVITLFVIASNYFLPVQIRRFVGGTDFGEYGAVIATFLAIGFMIVAGYSQAHLNFFMFEVVSHKFKFILYMVFFQILGVVVGEYIGRHKSQRPLYKNIIGGLGYFLLGTGVKFMFAFYVTFYILLDLIIYYQ